MCQVLFNAVLENACSEQGARMSAMDSSSRNAGEMLDRLTLTYNRFSFPHFMNYPSVDSELGKSKSILLLVMLSAFVNTEQ